MISFTLEAKNIKLLALSLSAGATFLLQSYTYTICLIT